MSASFPARFSACALIFISFPAIAAEPRTSPDEHACALKAPGYLDGRLAIWQQRLNLSDWKISIIMSRRSQLKPNTLGHIRWDSTDKSAVIRVLDASEYDMPCRDMLADMEFTVVHELIHLELSSLPRSEASRRDEEFAVNRIARALLDLDRQKAAAQAR